MKTVGRLDLPANAAAAWRVGNSGKMSRLHRSARPRSGWLEARLNQESAPYPYGRFGISGLNPRTHTHSRVVGVVHEPTVGVVPAAGQHRAIPS
jgi:hypothetical protein